MIKPVEEKISSPVRDVPPQEEPESKKDYSATLRTVEKNGGIDSFLLNAFNKNLSSDARKYKKSISKASVQNNSKKD